MNTIVGAGWAGWAGLAVVVAPVLCRSLIWVIGKICTKSTKYNIIE
jgi:hypothetical protein